MQNEWLTELIENSKMQKDIAKESLKLYINAYRLAEKYSTIATNCYDTAEVIKELINRITIKIRT